MFPAIHPRLRKICNAVEGYRVDYIQPVDMFPQTAHVESVVSLKLK